MSLTLREDGGYGGVVLDGAVHEVRVLLVLRCLFRCFELLSDAYSWFQPVKTIKTQNLNQLFN